MAGFLSRRRKETLNELIVFWAIRLGYWLETFFSLMTRSVSRHRFVRWLTVCQHFLFGCTSNRLMPLKVWHYCTYPCISLSIPHLISDISVRLNRATYWNEICMQSLVSPRCSSVGKRVYSTILSVFKYSKRSTGSISLFRRTDWASAWTRMQPWSNSCWSSWVSHRISSWWRKTKISSMIVSFTSHIVYSSVKHAIPNSCGITRSINSAIEMQFIGARDWSESVWTGWILQRWRTWTCPIIAPSSMI